MMKNGKLVELTLVQGGKPAASIPNTSLTQALASDAYTTWLAMCRLRGQLDGIKAHWDENTQPIERMWLGLWSHQLEGAMEIFLQDHPELKASGGE